MSGFCASVWMERTWYSPVTWHYMMFTESYHTSFQGYRVSSCNPFPTFPLNSFSLCCTSENGSCYVKNAPSCTVASECHFNTLRYLKLLIHNIFVRRWHQIQSTSDDRSSHVSVLDKNVHQIIQLIALVCDSGSLSVLGRLSFPGDVSSALKKWHQTVFTPLSVSRCNCKDKLNSGSLQLTRETFLSLEAR